MAATPMTANDTNAVHLVGQTFTFGRRVFVSGLFWQPLPGASAHQRKLEMKEVAEEQDFDLAVQRTSGVPQAGFGALADGVKPGMLSVAAMVSKSLEIANRDRSFLCALPVPGGKWLYVAQREGVLLHDGDLLGNEDTIRARLHNDLSLADWQTVFAPNAWGIPNASERSFEELLPKSGSGDKYAFKRWWEVRPIRITLLDYVQGNIKLVIAAAVLLLLMLGYYAYGKWQNWRELQELQRQEAMVQTERAAALAIKPWGKLPRAGQFAAVCEAALQQVGSFWPGGWMPKEAVCQDAQLKVSWERLPTGRIDHLLALLPQAQVAEDGDHAEFQLPLELPQGTEEALPEKQARMLALNQLAQSLAIKLSLQPQSIGSTILGQPARVAGGWDTLGWKLEDSLLAPHDLMPLLDEHGLRIVTIRLGFASGSMKWNMEGVQYVQP